MRRDLELEALALCAVAVVAWATAERYGRRHPELWARATRAVSVAQAALAEAERAPDA